MRKVFVSSAVALSATFVMGACTTPVAAPVPLTSTTVTAGNGTSGDATISANGNVVVFASKATDLVPGTDANGIEADVFAYDRTTGVTERITNGNAQSGSVSYGTGPSPSEDPAPTLRWTPVDVSADGRYVAFTSQATDLTATPTPASQTNAYRYDRLTHTTVLVSNPSSCPGWATIDNMLASIQISADGSTVAEVRVCAGYAPPDGLYQNLGYVRIDHVGGTSTDIPFPVTEFGNAVYSFVMSGDASVIDVGLTFSWSRLTVATGTWSANRPKLFPMSVSYDGRYVAVLNFDPSSQRVERLDTVTNDVVVIPRPTNWAILSPSGQYAATEQYISVAAGVTTKVYSRWEVGAGTRPIASGERTYVSPPETWTGGTAWTSGTSVADDGTIAYSRRAEFATPSMQIAIAS